MKLSFFNGKRKGQTSSIMAIVMTIIIIVAVAIPVTQQVIASANLTGITATVVRLIPLLLGVAGLAFVMTAIKA